MVLPVSAKSVQHKTAPSHNKALTKQAKHTFGKRERKAKVHFIKREGRKMASHNQSYRAGETKGRAEEKTNQAMGAMGEKAREAKEKTYETGRAAREKAHGAADSTKEWASDAAQTGREKAQAGKETTGGILEQTGEKVKSMAQGAAEAVKSTFGMAQHDEDVDKSSNATTNRRV
uniref:Uncharacterized protein n=2 Tax=Cucumis sativus TaxID=3659 RepID=A0A0A0K6E1_CUCSA